MNRYRKSMALAVACIVLFVLAGIQNHRLNSAPGNRTLVIEGAPPSVTFVTVVLGGFRGLVADALWLRASHLQEEGRYFELTQLADWITQMEPHAVQVWAFHAWNMAYNVSIMMSDDDERWQWVWNGILLLRDGALRANPSSADLYAELAWLLHHKVAASYDPAHATYKRRFALKVEHVLPGGRLSGAETPMAMKQLHERFGLREDRLRAIDASAGPFDWRAADAHSFYWATLGRDCAGSDHRARLRCERAMYQAMARMFFAGDVGDLTGKEPIVMRPRVDLLSHVVSCFERTLSEEPGEAGVLSAYSGFLASAVLFLDASGDANRARSVYGSLRERMRGTHVTLPDYKTFVGDDAVLAGLPPYAFDAVLRVRKKQQ